jgi:RNA polymerase sigma factor (sigma-70 family)
MNQPPSNEHLSEIITAWTVLGQAQHGSGDEASEAQRQLLERYGPAVYRYLLAAVRNQDIADDLFQEFALRFVRGAFKNARPEKGKFRHFLKTSLYHLVVDHQRKQQRELPPLSSNTPEPMDVCGSHEEADREFLECWRKQLLDRAWEALAEWERQSGQPLYTILRYRTDHPGVRSEAMAEHFSPQFDKPLNAQWIRKRLYLAREKFTEFLIEEVARSIGYGSAEDLEEELADLELLESCREALRKRKSGN